MGKSFTTDGFGQMKISGNVLVAEEGSTRNDEFCGSTGEKTQLREIFTMCRAYDVEDKDWYVFQAIEGPDYDFDCLGAGDAISLPPKYVDASPSGVCRTMLYPKPGNP